MDVFLVQLLVFAAVMAAVFGVKAAFFPEKTADSEPRSERKPGFFHLFQNEIEQIGTFLEGPIGRAFPAQTDQIRNDLVASALTSRLSVRDIRGLQGLLGFMTFLIVTLTAYVLSLNPGLALLCGICAGLVAWMWPAIWLHGAAGRRREAISKALPFAMDLLTVAMQAGQDFGAAVRFFVSEGPKGPLNQELAIMLRETELGKTRSDALRALAARTQLDEMQSLITAIIQSTEMGASVAETMRLQSEELRRSRFHRAERKAARAPSIMLIPVALFIVPAVFIIILVPVGIRVMDTLGISL